MCAGLIGSLLTWLTYSSYIGHCDHIKTEPTVALGQTDLVSIETYKGSMLEEAK